MNKLHKDKEIDKVVRGLVARGWTILPCSKHFKIRSPGGHMLSLSISPSCGHASKRIEQDARKIERIEQDGSNQGVGVSRAG